MDLDRAEAGAVGGDGRPRPDPDEVVGSAVRIFVARRGCTRADAHWLLSRAAPRNNLSVTELAACVVAEHELRTSPGGR
jgi:hypothetical protein